MKIIIVAASVAAIACPTPAFAVNVTLSGSVINSCVLTLSSPGSLTLSNDGTTLGSAQTGGSAAVLTVAAAGSAPTLTFAAPTLTSGAATSGAVTEVAYNASGSGANQAYTTNQTTASSNLIDTFTVNARVTRSAGFASGTYSVTTVVTCGQP